MDEILTGGLLVLHVSIVTVTFCTEKAGLYCIYLFRLLSLVVIRHQHGCKNR